jgi:hypothetical protein
MEIKNLRGALQPPHEPKAKTKKNGNTYTT